VETQGGNARGDLYGYQNTIVISVELRLDTVPNGNYTCLVNKAVESDQL
jgi:hypothetical protein